MALFGKTKKTAPAVKKPGAPIEKEVAVSAMPAGSAHVLIHPRITEKATMHGAMGVYTFDVAESANKHQIAQAIRELYKVTPRMVRIVRIPSKIKLNSRTGKRGVKRGGKKAYIYLKKGDSITMNQTV
ncbi:MAG: 50S ribosomal protein L23 [Candidatus Kaiserbacteria bacterium]|mgnify:CR=1 FL=1|nr:50S ribosomal protein L23 [Candidatus Kaiserbacteria bacterium]